MLCAFVARMRESKPVVRTVWGTEEAVPPDAGLFCFPERGAENARARRAPLWVVRAHRQLNGG